MELHSYAKRRASKKWTIEQKRKLVEARINYDSWFNSKPSNSVIPWKKVLSVAKLDDFNVFFVRKQWSNMLTRYKQYKQTRIDGLVNKAAAATIDAEMIHRINQEWEFFEAIHTFMTRKTTNLHSYAVTQKCQNSTNGSVTSDANNGTSETHADGNDDMAAVGEQGVSLAESLSRTLEHSERKHTMPKEGAATAALVKLQHDCVKENIPNNTTILLQAAGPMPEDDAVHRHLHLRHHIFSSDTNEEFEVICGAGGTDTESNDVMRNRQTRNTDHDFYSKRMAVAAAAAGVSGGSAVLKFPTADERQLHYFEDTSEESMGTEYVYQTPSTTMTQSYSLPSVMENIELHTEDGRTFEIKSENLSQLQVLSSSTMKQQQSLFTNDDMMPSTSTDKRAGSMPPQHPTSSSTYAILPPAAASSSSISKKLSERDKYYRHKRRFNRRLEKRFDAILNVMGQVVKSEYPSVDIKPLMDSISSAASGLSKVLTSESEEENDDGDAEKSDNENQNSATEPRPSPPNEET